MEDLRTNILKAVKYKLQELIEEDIDENYNFYDAGGNSMLAIHFLSWLSNYYQVNLTVKDLFENNILELTEIIKQENEATV